MTTQSEGGKINRTGRLSLRNLAEFNWGRALRAAALLGLTLGLFAQGARAQDDELFTDGSGKGFTPQSGPTCSGGTAVDDGSIEQGYRLAAADARVVQRLTPPSYPAKLTRVCACWLSNDDNVSASFNFLIYDDDGPSGTPGTLLGSIPSSVSIPTASTSAFIGQDCTALDLNFTSGSAFIGVQWNGATNDHLFACLDSSATTPANPIYHSGNGSAWQPLTNSVPSARAMLYRAEFTPTGNPDPTPPAGPWLTTAALPGFQFKSRIDGSRIATKVTDCVPETLCLAGAIPSRTEIFVRIIGPRPNGFLWPEVIRFTVSQVELWVQKTAGGPINYYQLAGVPQDSDVLNGLVDRQGFTP